MDAVNSTNFSSLSFYCKEIEEYFGNSLHTTLIHVHLLLLAAILIAVAVLLWQWSRQRIVVHPNLLILFGNIILLYLLHALSWMAFVLRYRILLFISTDSCDLLTPAWLVPLFHAPLFAYTVAFPSFHFAIMLERIRATFMAHRYEHEGSTMTVCMVLTIWILSLGYMFYVICSAFADTGLLGHPQGIAYLTSKYNAQLILYVMFFALFLTTLTALCDWRIFVLNRRIRAMWNTANSYNLSLNYQLNENALAMQLILPLDISYALLYPVYISLIILVRALRPQLSLADYNFFHHVLNTLLFFHSFLTLVVYIRFVQYMRANQRRNNEQVNMATENARRIYFQQLLSQWDQ